MYTILDVILNKKIYLKRYRIYLKHDIFISKYSQLEEIDFLPLKNIGNKSYFIEVIKKFVYKLS